MKKVYFDTNIYTHIRNRDYGISTADVVRLTSKIEGFKLRVYLSSVVLEETTSAILSAEKEALDRLKIIHRIARQTQVLTRYQDIVEGVIKAYIADSPLPNFLVPPPFLLRHVLKNQSPKTMAALRELATESREEVKNRKQSNQELFEKIWPLAKDEKLEGDHQTFEDYWKEHSLYVVEKFADLAGVLQECQRKGSEGLLDLTVTRTIAVGMLSQGYSNTYRKTSINRGDFNDLQHAVYGAAVGTLLTHDGPFTKLMKRLPIDGLEIIDLATLLSQI